MEMLLSSTIEVAIWQKQNKTKQKPYSNTHQLFNLSVWPTESSSFVSFTHAHIHATSAHTQVAHTLWRW